MGRYDEKSGRPKRENKGVPTMAKKTKTQKIARKTLAARKLFEIIAKGKKFILQTRRGKKVLGKFESYQGAYKARARAFAA